MKRLLPLLFILSFESFASNVPNLTCSNEKVVFIDPVKLESKKSDSSNIYRFFNDDFYISAVDRQEYLYGKLENIEYLRFNVGHKTIIFDSNNFDNALIVHTNNDEVRVSRIRCVRN